MGDLRRTKTSADVRRTPRVEGTLGILREFTSSGFRKNGPADTPVAHGSLFPPRHIVDEAGSRKNANSCKRRVASGARLGEPEGVSPRRIRHTNDLRPPGADAP